MPLTTQEEPPMPWWLWILFGLGLLAGELLTPTGFFLLFFGVAALIVGFVVALGPPLPAWAQGLGFIVLSIVAVLAVRLPAQRWLHRSAEKLPSVDSILGAEAVARALIPPDRTGAVDLHGTVWKARNGDAEAIADGARCYVREVIGVTLIVTATRPTRQGVIS
jgi:inner membrane protein